MRPVRGKWGKERTENKQKEGADEQNRRTKGSRKRLERERWRGKTGRIEMSIGQSCDDEKDDCSVGEGG